MQFNSFSRLYYRSAAAAILVYDVADGNTFESLKTWTENLTQYGPENFIIAIVGNKVDLEERREVSAFVTASLFPLSCACLLPISFHKS